MHWGKETLPESRSQARHVPQRQGSQHCRKRPVLFLFGHSVTISVPPERHMTSQEEWFRFGYLMSQLRQMNVSGSLSILFETVSEGIRTCSNSLAGKGLKIKVRKLHLSDGTQMKGNLRC